MTSMLRNITLVFAAGCLGGLVNSLAVWFFGDTGITPALGVKIKPMLSAAWLYPRIVWGGIWGFLFLLPFKRNLFLLNGLICSLGPTLIQLFVIFPIKAKKGVMGLELGTLTPLFVIFFNAIWGLTTALWLRWVGK